MNFELMEIKWREHTHIGNRALILRKFTERDMAALFLILEDESQ